MGNTIESLRKLCNVKDWGSGGEDIITEKVFENAERFRSILPENWELFPTGRNSVQFQDTIYNSPNCVIVELYYEIEIYEYKVEMYIQTKQNIECSYTMHAEEFTFNDIDKAINYITRYFGLNEKE